MAALANFGTVSFERFMQLHIFIIIIIIIIIIITIIIIIIITIIIICLQIKWWIEPCYQFFSVPFFKNVGADIIVVKVFVTGGIL